MAEVAWEVLCAAFDGRPPEAVVALWPRTLAERHALTFKACPIVTVGGSRAPRIYVSNGFEDAAFVDRLEDTFGDARIRPFLTRLGPEARKMVDTDGAWADLYLDDLQDVPHDIPAPTGHTLMCASLHIPSGRRTWITRHGPLPTELLDAAWMDRVAGLRDAGLDGLWAARWDDAGLRSLVCVNEQRWSGDPTPSCEALDALKDPTWGRCREAARTGGLTAYPDAVELRTDGSWDITIGLFDPSDPRSRRPR